MTECMTMNRTETKQYWTFFCLPFQALFSMWENSADHVEDVLQGNAQQRTNGRYQGLGWWHYCPKNHNQHYVYLYARTKHWKCKNNVRTLKETAICKKMYNTVILVTPLGSRHHLGHGAHEVFVCDSYGVDIQHKFLWWRVDLRIATSQCTQGSLWTHSLDVRAAITWQTKRQTVRKLNKTISIQPVVVGELNFVPVFPL